MLLFAFLPCLLFPFIYTPSILCSCSVVVVRRRYWRRSLRCQLPTKLLRILTLPERIWSVVECISDGVFSNVVGFSASCQFFLQRCFFFFTNSIFSNAASIFFPFSCFSLIVVVRIVFGAQTFCFAFCVLGANHYLQTVYTQSHYRNVSEWDGSYSADDRINFYLILIFLFLPKSLSNHCFDLILFIYYLFFPFLYHLLIPFLI